MGNIITSNIPYMAYNSYFTTASLFSVNSQLFFQLVYVCKIDALFYDETTRARNLLKN